MLQTGHYLLTQAPLKNKTHLGTKDKFGIIFNPYYPQNEGGQILTSNRPKKSQLKLKKKKGDAKT
jgi:hypothetical protein